MNKAGKTEEIYKHMEVDGLRFHRWSEDKHAVVHKFKEIRNPNILFCDGLSNLFFLEVDHEGKTMLEEASALGHFNSTFVLGMMLLAEGRQRMQEALDMLNNAYRRTKGTWNPRATYSKVHFHLNRYGRKHVHFHGFHRTCVMHRFVISVSDAFFEERKSMARCQIFLWDARFIRFAGEFGIIYK
ncbi:unnamed protein product [Lactuca saligna]|uniref:At2g35280-like TPR domain-containing protein n=1 Tax=Lactuca saligna TaxID=75948 RepID=A0AA35Z249_LACSI|nr:unnamed protein product [Lactuca saligna]